MQNFTSTHPFPFIYFYSSTLPIPFFFPLILHLLSFRSSFLPSLFPAFIPLPLLVFLHTPSYGYAAVTHIYINWLIPSITVNHHQHSIFLYSILLLLLPCLPSSPSLLYLLSFLLFNYLYVLFRLPLMLYLRLSHNCPFILFPL